MKKILCILILAGSLPLYSQTDFDSYFHDRTLRVDFMFAGNSSKTKVYPVSMKEEGKWAGPVNKLTDPFNYGNFRYELYSMPENRLVFQKGFSSLYQEWQTTAEAKNIERSFYEVVKMPFPKNKVRLVLSVRERNGSFSVLYETIIDPSDYFIRKESPVKVGTARIHGTGDPHSSVDLVFVAEGYRQDEIVKFREDVKNMTEVLFSEAPFGQYRDRFNIWAVEAVSQESGTDIPGKNTYANTALNSSFYTFDLDRYLTTQDIKSVNDYAAVVPHDHIIVLVNSADYGGGGVYNYYSGTTARHELSPKVFIHEFGHGFAGLADEYYSSEVAYEEFYPLNVEPWEPNITTMVDFGSKWKALIAPGTPVPTPAEEKYRNTTGLFEGGGYSARGIFRPEIDCRMKSNGPKGYCNVCKSAIEAMIRFYSE
ncbi:MAG: IgA Peptidase M64 [Bacteroidales bacterium]|jgi:hypothetical protein|nr:IgA Peptidase M64 [Bacteroidales bacterium]MCU0408784.1 IgA Peptidase M64 [Bacteroidales bacterium]